MWESRRRRRRRRWNFRPTRGPTCVVGKGKSLTEKKKKSTYKWVWWTRRRDKTIFIGRENDCWTLKLHGIEYVIKLETKWEPSKCHRRNRLTGWLSVSSFCFQYRICNLSRRSGRFSYRLAHFFSYDVRLISKFSLLKSDDAIFGIRCTQLSSAIYRRGHVFVGFPVAMYAEIEY